MDKLIDAINNLTINDIGYELNTETASDTQGDLTSDPDIVTHTRNIILHQQLLSCRTIGELFVLTPLTKPMIRLTPQTLLTPALKEIFADTKSGNTYTDRTLWKIIRTFVDISIPIYTPIHSGMSKYSTPSSLPCGLNTSPNIGYIRQSATIYLRKSNKLDTYMDGHLTYNLVAPPIFTKVLCGKLL